MDLVTHALSGMAIGAVCAPTERARIPMMLVGAAAAITPDLDALSRIGGQAPAWRHHRVLLHGIPTLPIQGGIVWIVAWWLWPGTLQADALALCIGASLLTHLLLDAATSFGTALAYPLSRRRYSSRSHFIIDPVILLGLAWALAVDEPALGLALTGGWLLVGMAVRHRLFKMLRHQVAQAFGPDCLVLIEPVVLSPLRWLIVVRHSAWSWSVSEVTWRGRLTRPWLPVQSEIDADSHARAAQIPVIEAFLATCDCPRWTAVREEDGRTNLIVEDLKWWVLPPFRPLSFKVTLATSAEGDRASQMPMWWTGPASTPAPPPDGPLEPSVVIVTTAAPPWFTGTSINPLYRAREFARRGWRVTLIFPWVMPADQPCIFPSGTIFTTPAEQADWIRWHFDAEGVDLRFYPAAWHARWRSIFPKGPLANHLPASRYLILEEPEHLGLFTPHRAVRRQMNASRVIGVLHTNYRFYVQSMVPSALRPVVGAVLAGYLSFVARQNCHDLIRLSPALTGFKRSRVENINGVAPPFLEVGCTGSEQGLYFIGKLAWEKGLAESISLLADAGASPLHVFGSGEPEVVRQISDYATERGVRLIFQGPSLKPWQALGTYKIFVNCSRSEVLCTATAEALAMGKFALVPRHPSNAFYEGHPNCLVYDSPAHFRQLLSRALHSKPRAFDAAQWFSWAAAHERLLRLLTAEAAPQAKPHPSPPRVRPTI